ncbi:efflux transporter outer membrane subunit [Legionella bozemanae]|uniref:Outer membrane efflux protein n=1 Tax=Legionella bozemanae TaxID=447 RepID=A0A0W0RUN6_LEGBO|nr:efflux transporter outer membrane subunit [Legionella bozemanae]KTC74802.1 outer membrane efflux protein [Legionella bozemanae]STO34345.1 Probable efflux pump outer membrane protein ttgC precursor [Legionella bozemanae]
MATHNRLRSRCSLGAAKWNPGILYRFTPGFRFAAPRLSSIKKRKIFSFLALASLSLSSCMVGPNYVPPKLVVPPQFKEAKGKKIMGTVRKNWKPIQPQDDIDRGEWWKIFNEPVLNDLENQLNHFNQSIVNAEANFRQSLAIVDQARANLYPTVVGAFSLFRQRQAGGATSIISTSGTSGTATTNIAPAATTTTIYSAFLNASWEPDIWGLVRRTIEADLSLAQSNEALIGVTRLSAQGALAQYYFELRTLDKAQKYLDETVIAYRKILIFTRNQYKSGVVSRAEVVQAQIQLESAQASAINNGILRGQYEHAIAVLMGRPPAYFSLKPAIIKLKPPAIPLEVPTAWLERRPDIAQAERLVQQASALIGVAVAAYFPNLTLNGTVSAAGRSFHQLIHKPAISWSAGMQLAETFFDGGYRAAGVRAAKEQYIAQVANYRQVVLTAFQDVEDNLISLRLLEKQGITQDKQATDALYALKIVKNQYKAGTVPYMNVLTAQISALAAEQAATQIDGLQMTSAVGLVKALGGGWVAVIPPKLPKA